MMVMWQALRCLLAQQAVSFLCWSSSVFNTSDWCHLPLLLEVQLCCTKLDIDLGQRPFAGCRGQLLGWPEAKWVIMTMSLKAGSQAWRARMRRNVTASNDKQLSNLRLKNNWYRQGSFQIAASAGSRLLQVRWLAAIAAISSITFVRG
jgi:hypothetical protein